uniref:Uncharacterized protein n=1 Tax=Oryza brachyantha TaxID=4533 RepID=J3N1N7_ORYBR
MPFLCRAVACSAIAVLLPCCSLFTAAVRRQFLHRISGFLAEQRGIAAIADLSTKSQIF